uniref:Uncharacterized protein n=1 Tax=Aegilops tauschii TaxID=37682 RepID=R7WEN9_AEGTA
MAYDVEDTLQEFAVRLEKQSWWRIRRNLLDRRRVAKQMKELRANVEDVSQRSMRYNLIKGPASKAAMAAEQSSITSAALFSIDDAREVYENPDTKGKFPCRAWVRPMHPFNPKDFIQSMVEQFHLGVGAKALLGAEKPAPELAEMFDEY